MTMIYYFPKKYRVVLIGHAGYAEAGKDIVCAAISGLTNALIERAIYTPGFKAMVSKREKIAAVIVRCRPGLFHKARARMMFETIMDGYRVLAEQYPDNVKIEEVKK